MHNLNCMAVTDLACWLPHLDLRQEQQMLPEMTNSAGHRVAILVLIESNSLQHNTIL